MGKARSIVGTWLMLSGLVWETGQPVLRAADPRAPDATCLVRPDGTVLGPAIPHAEGAGGRVRVRQEFCLPKQPPDRRWVEGDRFPVCHTTWEKDGIRYTQSVLATSIRVATADGESNTVPVLLVRLKGECLADEYTDASAAYAVQGDGKNYDLKLQDGLVYATDRGESKLLAALEIASSGIQTNSGPKLTFWAHMPPGTSGSMIIKVPSDPLAGEKAVHALQDLDFDDELWRLKQEWRTRPVPREAWPVRFAD